MMEVGALEKKKKTFLSSHKKHADKEQNWSSNGVRESEREREIEDERMFKFRLMCKRAWEKMCCQRDCERIKEEKANPLKAKSLKNLFGRKFSHCWAHFTLARRFSIFFFHSHENELNRVRNFFSFCSTSTYVVSF